MNEIDIRKYASLMSELGLTGLEIKEDGSMVRLERAPANTVATAVSCSPVGLTAQTAPQAEFRSEYMIESPMVGVFYSASAENAEPFVQIGSAVKKGDTLCIIEAMKLMNEITADEDGVISEICVTNGQVVDFGHTLFRIKKI